VAGKADSLAEIAEFFEGRIDVMVFCSVLQAEVAKANLV
jgi:hypothetical protein